VSREGAVGTTKAAWAAIEQAIDFLHDAPAE
jgi:hypothetical protein